MHASKRERTKARKGLLLALVMGGGCALDRDDVFEKGKDLCRFTSLVPHLRTVDVTLTDMKPAPGLAVRRKTLNVSYAIIGDDYTKPLVILVHGGPGGKTIWSEVIFGAEGLRGLTPDAQVLALDLVGHGITEGGLRGFLPYCEENLTYFLQEFVDAINKKEIRDRPLVLVGHSYGGEACWRYAVKHHQRIQRLVLIDSAGFPRLDRELSPGDKDINGFWAQSFVDFPWITRQFLNKKDIERDLRYLYFDKSLLDDGQIVDEYSLFMRFGENLFANMCLTHREVERQDRTKVVDDLKKIACPTTLLWGRDDPCYTYSTQGLAFKRYISDSKLFVLCDCGHCPHEEHPGRVAQFIRRSIGLDADVDPSWMSASY